MKTISRSKAGLILLESSIHRMCMLHIIQPLIIQIGNSGSKINKHPDLVRVETMKRALSVC